MSFLCIIVKGTCCWNAHGGYMQLVPRMGPSLDCSPFQLCCHCQGPKWSNKYHNTTDFKELGIAAIKPSQPGASAVLHYNGISQGFQIGFTKPPKPLKSAKRNLKCALQHPNTVTQYLADEIMQHCVAGPFQGSTIPEAHISRFGVILSRQVVFNYWLVSPCWLKHQWWYSKETLLPYIHHCRLSHPTHSATRTGHSFSQNWCQECIPASTSPPRWSSLAGNEVGSQHLHRHLSTFWTSISPKVV